MRVSAALSRAAALAGPGAGAGRWQRHRLAIAYGAFAVLVFVLFLAESLPHDRIAAAVLASATSGAPIVVDFKDVAYAFPNGYRFQGVRIAPLAQPEVALQLTDLTVRTPLLGLLLGRPNRASLAGDAYEGTFQGEVEDAAPRIEAVLHADSLDLGRALAAFLPPPATVSGRASFELTLAGDGRTTRSADGDLHLRASGVALGHLIVQGFAVPDLSFSDCDLTAQIRSGRVQVRELRASGPDVEVSASGDVLLREPVQTSILNLRLSIAPTGTSRPEIRILTGLLPRRGPGDQPTYNLSGTLAAPVLR